MKFVELISLLKGEAIFKTSLLLTGTRSPSHLRRQLNRWVRAGKIVMLRRGVYVVAPPFVLHQPHPFVMANAMRQASYVSLQSALAHYGMIPEYTPVVTSATTNRPEELTTPLGRFVFRHVKRDMFFGVREEAVAPGQMARMATPEKAIVDLLYLTPGSDNPSYLEEWRLEPGPELNRKQLQAFARRCGSAKVIRAVRRLEERWRGLQTERLL